MIQASGADANIEVPKWDGIYPVKKGEGRIKRVIHLCMAGGPSHLETLDPKPELGKMDGKPMPKLGRDAHIIWQRWLNTERYPWLPTAQVGTSC